MSPSSGGSAPHDVAVSCSATNASSYRIDCGNGVSNLASTALCRYTTAGTYTPKCTVNGTISSPACQSTVNVSAPPPTPKCSTTITGVVTNPLSTATPGLCDIGSLDITSFGVSVVTNTTYYTWKCKNGTELSPPCSANYTPVTPASPDLKLKKYVNNVDAQNNGTAVNIPNNSTFTYTVTVENVGLGSLTPSLTTVYDPLPAGVTLTATPL